MRGVYRRKRECTRTESSHLNTDLCVLIWFTMQSDAGAVSAVAGSDPTFKFILDTATSAIELK